MTKYLFSFSGVAGSGKDTVADILREKLSIRKDHFAYDLKNIAKTYLNWNGLKDKKGRKLLQFLGTEVARSYFDNIWLIKFGKRNGIPTKSLGTLPGDQLSDEERLTRLALHLSIIPPFLNNSYLRSAVVSLLELGWDGNLEDPQGKKLLQNLENIMADYDPVFAATAKMNTQELFKAVKKNNSDGSFNRLEAHKREKNRIEAKIKNYEKFKLHKLFLRLSKSRKAILEELKAELQYVDKEIKAEEAGIYKDGLVVPDARFPNEIKYLRENGFINVRVDRKGLKTMGHASETSFQNEKFHVVIQNYEGKDKLEEKVEKLIELVEDGKIGEGMPTVTL